MSADPKDTAVNWSNTVKLDSVQPTDTSNMITYLTEGADLSEIQTASTSDNKLFGFENFTKNNREQQS